MVFQLKNITLSIMLLLFALSCNKRGSDSSNPTIEQDSSYIQTPNAATQELNDIEKVEVLFLWEEEKLARDVYKKMYGKYGKKIFSSIASSEQKHMDSVKKILDKLNLSTPVSSSDIGIFKDPEIVKLYQDLLERGNNSLYDAYRVGLEIELMDIEDLARRIDNVTDPAMKNIYQNLLEASYNHKEAFEKNL